LAQFGLLYVGEPQFASQEEQQAHFAKYMQWMESINDVVVQPAMRPMGPPIRVTSEGASSETRADRLTGMTVIEADDIDAAVAIAQSCPYIEVAALDVVEMIQMHK
jgi:hypothetical protein